MPTTSVCRIMPPECWDEEISILRRSVHPADFWTPDGAMVIADARAVRKFASTTPTGSRKVVVLVGADTWTPPVANALLKLIEEPPEFLELILYSSTANLLDTVASRVRVEGLPSKNTNVWSELLDSNMPVTPQLAENFRQLLFLQAVTHIGHDTKRIVRSLHFT